MLTLKELIKNQKDFTEDFFAEVSDNLWEIGEIEDIKNQTDEDLFLFHIAVNIIGNWKGDGWWEFICNYPNLICYVPAALEALKLSDMKTAFENVIKCFPENTVFEDSAAYVDTVNFLQNVRFKISDTYLNSIPADRRKEMSEALHKSIDDLESLTDKRWGYDAKDDGWSDVIDFIEESKEA
ncbi:hypothetical protein [Treponema pedis]|uniref:hypothetical protein n=1 Tax=Treponema pedis TaxID=409322 RepID=UPI001981CD8B|nr:hypothetical protein [Treponema pedis]QSI04565.1 hypothetical protein DYQ05_06265 [Treponema pedis]